MPCEIKAHGILYFCSVCKTGVPKISLSFEIQDVYSRFGGKAYSIYLFYRAWREYFIYT